MFLFAGVSFAFMILGFFVFEEDEPSTEEDKRVDWIGAALVTAGLVLIVFVLSDAPTAHKGWNNPRKSSPVPVCFFSNSSQLHDVHRRHCLVPHRRPARTSFRRLAVLLGTQTQEPGSSTHALDGTTAHETIDVDTRAWSLCGHADCCVLQRGGVRMLAVMGTAVLSDVPEFEPDSNDAAHAAVVRWGPRRKRRHRAYDQSRQRHVHRRCGRAHDRLRGRPVRRDRPESVILGVWFPCSASGGAR